MTRPSDSYRIGRGLAGTSRARSLTLVAASYLVAGLVAAAAAGAAILSGRHPLAVTLIADLAATVAIFGLSIAVSNASLYDPYWSVAPPVIAACWAVYGWSGAPADATTGAWTTVPAAAGVHLRQVVVVALVAVWAVRLTANWVGTWRGLAHEDWRYVQLREQTRGRLPWWLVSFGGIQLMPTLVVFAGMLSVWPAVVVGHRPLGVLDALAALVTAAAITLETVADRQLHRFTADPDHRGRIADQGLWRHSRHPNYLGEIGFWWGLWLFGLAAAPHWWWTICGPLAVVVLFVTASVPLMDRRSLARRPGYARYARSVPALVPRPWRRARTTASGWSP